MAKTAFANVPDELKNLEAAALQRRDRFVTGSVQAQRALFSKNRMAVLKGQTIFKILSPLWRALTTDQKNVWKAASVYSGLSGWQLFLSDNSARLRNDLTLGVPPSNLWQVNAGRLFIESPATEISLKQIHPQQYQVLQKIVGKSWKKELVTLTENLTFPIDIAIRYKSNLSAVGDTQIARYRARVFTSYQGKEVDFDHSIDFDASADWTLDFLSIEAPRGIILGYALFLEISGYTGELLFDNIRAVHGGTNWARDPRCDEIEKQFLGAFAQVPPFWVPVVLPDGSSFASFYPPTL